MAEEEQSSFQNIISWVVIGTSIAFHFSLIFRVYKFIKGNLKLKDFPIIFLILSIINNIIWIDYALLKDEAKIFITFSICAGLSIIWVTLSLIHLSNSSIKLSIIFILISIAVIGGIAYTFYFLLDPDVSIYVLYGVNPLMYLALGEKIITICKTKKLNLIPRFATFTGLLNTTAWLIFGILENDTKYIIINGVGLFFVIAIFVLYFRFCCKFGGQDDIDLNDDNLVDT